MRVLTLKYCIVLITAIAFFFLVSIVKAQEEIAVQEKVYEGILLEIKKTEQEVPGTGFIPTFLTQVKITNGDKKDTIVMAELSGIGDSDQLTYKVGGRVLITEVPGIDGETQYFLTDHVRYPSLFWLFVLFSIVVVIVARWWGLRSLLGLGISFTIIFTFILPLISRGANPILIATSGGLIILIINFYLSHGFTQKTHIALLSTALSLILTGLLAKMFVEITNLTGFSSEEAVFLQIGTHGSINIKGLLLAGIIIGVLGILDDITISQAAVVQAIKSANPKMKAEKVFAEAMKVGHDHIASLVNTLILVYTGSTFPLLLLFLDSSKSYTEVINYEIIAEEIVRTLVGSIGLILSVPITTILATRFITDTTSK